MGSRGTDRRSFLKLGAFGAAGVAGASWLASCAPGTPGMPTTTLPGPPVPTDPVFDCGVVSGLHTPTAQVLWTRVAPGARSSVATAWEVATDPSFASVVATGTATAEPERDGCVKVLAEGLAPGTTHWYRFTVDGRRSPVGRTRTPAAPGSSPARVRLAVASCQNYPSGWYTAWRDVAALDLDAVVHLGDYIYESGSFAGPFDLRSDGAGAATDLASYRAKYRAYRSDPDLRAAHAAHAFAPVWDDHEVANDYSREIFTTDPQRAADAYRAWFEYQPVWPIEGTRIHRRVRWGDLVDLTLPDARQYRDGPPGGGKGSITNSAVEPGREIHAVGRTLLGAEQRRWYLDGLGAAQQDGVRWKVVGNQEMIAPVRLLDLDEPLFRLGDPNLPKHAGIWFNPDAWDGFQWERDLVLDFLRTERVANTAFVTGDIHSYWQAPLQADFDDESSPVVAQEFVCGSVSSRAFDLAGYDVGSAVSQAAANLRPGFRYVDLVRHGVGILECTPERMDVQFRVSDIDTPNGLTKVGTEFSWAAGTANDVAMTPR
ncbi:MAG: alkaline phosphatase D family protein [Microthrixaceae bacterium]